MQHIVGRRLSVSESLVVCGRCEVEAGGNTDVRLWCKVNLNDSSQGERLLRHLDHPGWLDQ
jgi:hypothetical protein